MPDWLTGAVAGGSGIVGGIINAASTAAQNKRSMRFARDMYDRQYQDNIAFWRMQNRYNDPAEQMSRLKAAGLNPALIYGGSSGGAAGTASPINTPDVQSPEFRTPMWGSGVETGAFQAINASYDLDIKQATIDNMQREGQLKEAQALLMLTQNERGTFDLNLERKLEQTSIDARQELVRQMMVNTQVTLDKNQREALMNAKNLEVAVEQIANMQIARMKDQQEVENMRQSLANMKKDGVLKDLTIGLREDGMDWGDSLMLRMGKTFIEKLLTEMKNGNTPNFDQALKKHNVLNWIFNFITK